MLTAARLPSALKTGLPTDWVVPSVTVPTCCPVALSMTVTRGSPVRVIERHLDCARSVRLTAEPSPLSDPGAVGSPTMPALATVTVTVVVVTPPVAVVDGYGERIVGTSVPAASNRAAGDGV